MRTQPVPGPYMCSPYGGKVVFGGESRWYFHWSSIRNVCLINNQKKHSVYWWKVIWSSQWEHHLIYVWAWQKLNLKRKKLHICGKCYKVGTAVKLKCQHFGQKYNLLKMGFILSCNNLELESTNVWFMDSESMRRGLYIRCTFKKCHHIISIGVTVR